MTADRSTLIEMAKKHSKAKHRKAKGRLGARRRGKQPSERPPTAQQQRFAEEVAKGDCTQKEAAKRAGYSARTAEKIASQLLDNPRVAALVQQLREKAIERAEIDAEKVIREWGRLGFSDIRDVVEVTARGVRVRPSAEWPEDAARAVMEVSETVTESGGTVRLKLHPKLGALDSLGKFLQLLVDRSKVEHSGSVEHRSARPDLSVYSVEEIKEILQLRAKHREGKLTDAEAERYGRLVLRRTE